MIKKDLTMADLPIMASEKVIEAFIVSEKIEKTTKILMDALFESVASMQTIDPWRVVRREMPEIATLARNHTLNYSFIDKAFVIKPEKQ